MNDATFACPRSKGELYVLFCELHDQDKFGFKTDTSTASMKMNSKYASRLKIKPNFGKKGNILEIITL